MIARAPLQTPTSQRPPDAREQLAAQTEKLVIVWEPRHNSDIHVELSGCIIFAVPEFLDSITEPKDQVMLALLGEIVEMRNQLNALTQRLSTDQLGASVQATKDQAVIDAAKEKLTDKAG